MIFDYECVKEATEFIQKQGCLNPSVGVILGSGLGGFADSLTDKQIVTYNTIPHFSASTVPGHAGQLVFGYCQNTPVVVMQGRVHCYEGYSPAQVVFPVRVLRQLGVKKLIITNAAGGINSDFEAGDLMLIDDHLNMMGQNPLVGENDERYGTRFPDMSKAYNPVLKELAIKTAKDLGIKLHKGNYAAMLGPSYETPAEIFMLKTIGADAVGMSTVPEVIVANHMKLDVCGISCITNLAAGIHKGTLKHDHIADAAKKSGEAFSNLLTQLIQKLS